MKRQIDILLLTHMGHKEWSKDGKTFTRCTFTTLLQNFEMNLMPVLFCYISQVIGQSKFDNFTSKMWRKKLLGSALRHQNIFSIKKQFALVLVTLIFKLI